MRARFVKSSTSSFTLHNMKHHLACLLRGLADRIDPPRNVVDVPRPLITYGENGTFTASSGSNYRLTFLPK